MRINASDHPVSAPREAAPGPRLAAPPIVAAILLAGGLAPSPLSAACGGSVLGLHLDDRATVLDLWADRVAELARHGLARGAVRVIVHGSEDVAAAPAAGGMVRFEPEPHPYRGPAGVARDVCGEYQPDDVVFLAEAARLASEDLVAMAEQHLARDADVTVAVNPDRSPAGVYLLRRSALDLVPPVGFVDLKEQWLSRLVNADRHVRVHRFTRRGTTPLRTREQFLDAIDAIHRPAPGRAGPDPRGYVSERASVGAGAYVRDSAILPGARIGAGAVVVRSIVVGGAEVAEGDTVVDRVVAPVHHARRARREERRR